MLGHWVTCLTALTGVCIDAQHPFSATLIPHAFPVALVGAVRTGTVKGGQTLSTEDESVSVSLRGARGKRDKSAIEESDDDDDHSDVCEELQRVDANEVAGKADAKLPPPFVPPAPIPFKEQGAVGTGPYDWLEDDRDKSERVDKWITEQNRRTDTAILGDGRKIEDTQLYKERYALLSADDQLPHVGAVQGDGYLYNWWQDDKNPRGLWRRTTPEEYQKNKPAWDVLFDLDAYNKETGMNWAGDCAWCWQVVLAPDYTRALITMSPTGNDKTHLFEFDLVTKQFVKGMDEGGDGFHIGYEAKIKVEPLDRETIFVAAPKEVEALHPEASTLSSEDTSVTESTYARTVKRWSRAESKTLADAKSILTVPTSYMWVDPEVYTFNKESSMETFSHILFDARPSYYTSRMIYHDDATKESVRLALPDEIDNIYFPHFTHYIIKLRNERWGFPADSVLVCDLSELLKISRAMTASIARENRIDAQTYFTDPSRFLEAHTGEFVMSNAEAQNIFFPLFIPTTSSSVRCVI